ncbi:hypothetical protein ACS126_06160 [Sphingobacterium lactis]|uniref:hypothetical protein n=1 Tax=Sphingobacterium TaxID=28453 RepID=UPI00257E5B95|nr:MULTISPECIES: hypothetical protein [Sphingobacterium]
MDNPAPLSHHSLPGLSLRVNHKGTDYFFRVIEPKQITGDSTRLSLLLNGQPLTMQRHGQCWRFADPATALEEELAQVIWRVLSLRYRL